MPRLPALLLAVFALWTLPAAAGQSGVVERYQSAPSPALGRPLAYNVYRPAADPEPGERWPVIYLLEGRPSESDWLDQGFVNEVVDAAVAAGHIPPALVVMPVAPFSWYVDNPDPGGQGMMMTAITRDLAAAVDARYPTATCREARAVAGLSMGGYGALLFGLDRPDIYGAAISLSGAITPPISRRDASRLLRADAFYDGAFGRPLERTRFNAWNLFTRLRALDERGGDRPDVFLAIGDRDRAGLLQSTTRLHSELLRAGVDSALRVGPGAHDWETWRRDFAQALEWLGPRLDPTCGRTLAGAEPRRADERAP